MALPVNTQQPGRLGALGASGRRAEQMSSFKLFASLLAVAITLLVLYPLGMTWMRVILSEEGLGGAVTKALGQRGLVGVLRNTFIVVGISVTAATIIGSAFAWLSERTDASIGWVTRTLPILPLLVPPIAGSAGWLVLGGPNAGFINVAIRAVLSWFGIELERGPFDSQSWYGMTFVYTLYLVPLVFMTVAAALRNLDPSLEEAARGSGATPARTLRTVTLPAVMPGILAGMLLALIYGFSLFSVPAILGRGANSIEVLSFRIVSLMRQYPPEIGTAMVLGLVMMAVIGTGLFLQRRVIKNNRFATISGRSASPMPIRLGPWKWPARIFMLGYFFSTAILPVFGLVIVSTQPFWSATINWGALSLERYEALLSVGTPIRTALQNSATIALFGALAAMLVAAVIAAYSNRRMHSWVGRVSDFTTKLPGAVSNILIGVAFVAAFAGPPIRIGGTLLILFLAYLVITLPQASFNASAAHAQVGRELEEASLASGASESKTFVRIVLPLMIPGLASGWALVFVLMAGDITASAMLAGPGNPVVGSFMLDMVNFGSYGQLATIAVGLIIVSSLVVFTGMGLSRRVFGAKARS